MENNKTEPKKTFSFKIFNRGIISVVLKWVFIGLVVCASFIIVKDEVLWKFDSFIYGDESDMADRDCNVMGVELRGDLITYISSTYANEEEYYYYDSTTSEDIVYNIELAENDEDIKAIILEVDSYGGLPVAGEEVALALSRAKKPTIALIRESGNSAAYMAASGADKIFASKNSDVGSIGVTMSYLDYAQQNQKEGLTYNILSSGKFKDAADPNKLLSPEEKNLLMRDVNILHQNFISLVSENRDLEIEKVEEIADGSTMLGEMALQNGLIDYIGGMPEVKDYLKKIIGEDVEICW